MRIPSNHCPRTLGRYMAQAFRDTLAGKLSPTQLATAQQLAQDWRPLTFEEAREVHPLPDVQMSFVECPPK